VPVPVEQDMIQGQLCKKEYQDTEPKIIQYQGYTLYKILAPSILGERGGALCAQVWKQLFFSSS